MGKRDAAAAEWEPYKAEIERLFLVEKKELSEVVAYMQNEHGFYRSAPQYTRQFAKWGFSKYLSQKDYEYIWYTMKKRKYEGKDTEFVTRGRKLGSTDLIKKLRRHLPKGFETIPLPENGPPTPEGIQVLTPPVRTNRSQIDIEALPFFQFQETLGRIAVFREPTCSYYFDFSSIPTDALKPWTMVTKEPDPSQLLEAVTIDQTRQRLPNSPAAILKGPPTDSLFYTISYCAYLSSNNLLGDPDLQRVVKWMAINERHLPLLDLLEPISPTAVIFMRQLLKSAAHLRYTGFINSLLEVCLSSHHLENTLRCPSLLLTAIRDNQVDLAGRILDTGVRPEGVGPIFDGVVEKGYDEMFKLLISRNIRPGLPDGWPPYLIAKSKGPWVLNDAVDMGQTKIVKTLLELKLLDIKEVHHSAFFAALKDNEDIVRLLVRAGIDVHTEFQFDYSEFDYFEFEYNEALELLFYPIQTPLQVAAHFGHWELVTFLVKHGAAVDLESSSFVGDSEYKDWISHVEDDYDITTDSIPVVSALQAAVRHENIGMTLFLLRKGAQVDSRPENRYGHTALQVAAAVGNKDLVNLLLEWKADVNAPPGPYMGSTSLQFAARLEDPEIFKTLVSRGAKINAMTDTEGRTLFQAAADAGSLGLVQFLLRHSSSDVNELPDPEGGRTALQAAAESHKPFSIDIMRVLLAAGANANASPAEKGGITALQGAAGTGEIAKAELLLVAGAQVEVYSEQYGFTALHKAVENRRPAMVAYLLRYGATPYYGASAVTGRTPFQEACFNGDSQIASLFLPESLHSPLPIFVNAPPSFDRGVTALQAAIESGNLELIEMLLNFGADPNAPGAVVRGQTALDRAVQTLNSEALKLLLERGARLPTDGEYLPPDMHRPILFVTDKPREKIVECILLVLGSGLDKRVIPKVLLKEALKTAVETGDFDLMDAILSSRILPIDAELQIWSRGTTGLHLAASNGDVERVKLFIKYGADVNATVSNHCREETALWLAVSNGHIEVAKYLVKQGAEVKLPRHLGFINFAPEKGFLEAFKYLAESRVADVVDLANTALQLAAQYGHIELVKYLLESGSTIGAAVHQDGLDTALQEAATRGYARIVLILLDAGADVTAPGGTELGERTAIESAAWRGRLDILCMLLQAHPPGQSLTDQLEKAEKLAEVAGHTEVLRIIRDYRERVSL